MSTGATASPSSTATPLSFRAVLAVPGMRRLWVAQFISIMGDFLALFAIISVASFRLHATPVQITQISLFYMLPTALAGPLAGVFVDRWNVKTTMIASDLIRAVLAFALVFAGTLPQFYVVLFLISLVSTFFGPAQSVTVRTIVPAAGLLNANALMMQAFLVTRIASPALAAALVGAFGPNSCFVYDSVSFLASALLLSGIAIKREPFTGSSGVGAVFRDLGSGLRFLFHAPALGFVIAAMGAGFFVLSCFAPLIAVWVRDFLHSDAGVFGLLSALIGVGMLAGTLLLRQFGRNLTSEQMVLAGLIALGGSVLFMAILPVLVLNALATFGLGFGVAFIITPAQALIQRNTPQEMLGRVSSSFMSVIAFSQMMGLILSGGAANQIGVRAVFYACAALLGVITCVGWWRMPKAVAS